MFLNICSLIVVSYNICSLYLFYIFLFYYCCSVIIFAIFLFYYCCSAIIFAILLIRLALPNPPDLVMTNLVLPL